MKLRNTSKLYTAMALGLSITSASAVTNQVNATEQRLSIQNYASVNAETRSLSMLWQAPEDRTLREGQVTIKWIADAGNEPSDWDRAYATWQWVIIGLNVVDEDNQRPNQDVTYRRVKATYDCRPIDGVPFCQFREEDGSYKVSEFTLKQSSPLMLDLDRNGIHLSKQNVGVYFDLDDTGTPSHYHWVIPNTDDAFLALDINGNGVIDSGAEMFGTGTELELQGRLLRVNSNKALDGFDALQQYDTTKLGGNNDGVISPADAIWSSLLLWTDTDADGNSTIDELSKLSDSRISVIPVFPERYTQQQDSAGNSIGLWTWVTLEGQGPKKMRMTDVYFQPIK